MKRPTSPHTTNSAQETALRRYASLGLGTAVLAGVVTTADASVVFTNFNNQLLNDTNTADTSSTNYGFDLDNNGTQDLRFFVRNQGSAASGNFAVVVAGLNGTQLKPINVVGIQAGNFYYPSRLGAGVTIGPSQPFVTLALTASSTYLAAGTFAFGNGFTNSKWATAGANQGYFGFSFTAADGLHYGFIGMTVQTQGNGSLSRAITLGGIAYESTPNTPITTFGPIGTVVPEPSSIALVALGGIGLVAYRRRRAAQKAAV